MFIQNLIGLFTDPAHAWEDIREQQKSRGKTSVGHVFVLALIPAISGYIGTTQVGWRIGVGDPIRITGDSAFAIAVIYYLALLVGVFTIGMPADGFLALAGDLGYCGFVVCSVSEGDLGDLGAVDTTNACPGFRGSAAGDLGSEARASHRRTVQVHPHCGAGHAYLRAHAAHRRDHRSFDHRSLSQHWRR